MEEFHVVERNWVRSQTVYMRNEFYIASGEAQRTLHSIIYCQFRSDSKHDCTARAGQNCSYQVHVSSRSPKKDDFRVNSQSFDGGMKVQ